MHDQSYKKYERYIREIINNCMNNDEAKKFIKNKLSRKIVVSYDIQIYNVIKTIVKNMNSSRVVLINDPHFQIEYRIICILFEQKLISENQKNKLIDIMKNTPINEHVDVPQAPISSMTTQYLLKILEEHKIESDIYYNQALNSLSEYIFLIRFLNKIDFTNFGLDEELKFIGYGSYVNGFGLNGSDVDTMICTSSFMSERVMLAHIQANYNRMKGDDLQIELQSFLLKENIRVPLLIFTHIETKISMDLCINNCLGVINSHMLKVYSTIDPRVEQLGKLVKIWAKRKQVSSQMNFSSYAIILLVIYFLQQKKIIPSLQKLSQKPSTIHVMKTVKNGVLEDFVAKVDFETNLEIIRDACEPNTESLDTLFKQFFQFYNKGGQFLSSNLACCIKGNPVLVSQEVLLLKQDSEYLFSIIDPFENNHNLGDRVRKSKGYDILLQFEQAIKYYDNDLDQVFKQSPLLPQVGLNLNTQNKQFSDNKQERQQEQQNNFQDNKKQSYLENIQSKMNLI